MQSKILMKQKLICCCPFQEILYEAKLKAKITVRTVTIRSQKKNEGTIQVRYYMRGK